jgi:hypothetical protein
MLVPCRELLVPAGRLSVRPKLVLKLPQWNEGDTHKRMSCLVFSCLPSRGHHRSGPRTSSQSGHDNRGEELGLCR